MRWVIVLFFFVNALSAQFTYSGYLYNANASGASNVPVKLYKRTVTTSVVANMNVKIFSTHGGSGSTSQYPAYPSTAAEMDKFCSTSYSNTVLKWNSTLAATTCLNFTAASTLTSAGATVPNSGDYYSVEVTGTFVPKETGTYTFGVNSDDGGDVLIGGTVVCTYYGGHGMGGYQTGTISLTSGTSYTFKARMQEYGGGDGLAVAWKRPSQSSLTLQTDEIGVATTTTSAWVLNITSNTNSSGYYSFSRTVVTGDEWYILVDAPTRIQAYTTADIQAVSNIVLGKTITTGLSFHMFDVNDDAIITVADKYYVAARKAGRFSKWRIAPDVRIFTTTQYNSIVAGTTNLRGTYPGVTNHTTPTLTSGGTLNLYIIAPGYSGAVTY